MLEPSQRKYLDLGNAKNYFFTQTKDYKTFCTIDRHMQINTSKLNIRIQETPLEATKRKYLCSYRLTNWWFYQLLKRKHLRKKHSHAFCDLLMRRTLVRSAS